MEQIQIKSKSRCEFVDITDDVRELIRSSGCDTGTCTIFTPHTTAGITINEGYDPDVQRDVLNHFEGLIPKNSNFRHAEGNSDSHIKAIMTGTSQIVIIEKGDMILGKWQSVFFCEYDGPRSRKVCMQIVPCKE